MAPKKDMIVLVVREALTEKATGKRKTLTQAADERDLRSLKRGQATPKTAPLQLVEGKVEGVEKGLPDLPTMRTPPFLLRSVGEGFSCQLKSTRERIKKALLLEDMKVFEQIDLEGLIRWS